MGVFLAEQRRCPCQGGPGCDHRANHDHPHQLCQRCTAKDFLHEIHRHLPLCLLLHGVWGSDRVCLCRLHRQEDTAEEEQVHPDAEDDGGEEAGGGKTDGITSNGIAGAADEPE